MSVGSVLLAAFAVAAVVSGATLDADTDMAGALDNSVDSDSLVISIKQIRPRKRQRLETETLLSVLTRGSNAMFSVKLDRGNKKVVIETQKEKKHISVESLTESRIINSIVIVLDQTNPKTEVQLFVDCILEGKIHLDLNLLHLFKKDPKFIVYRERRYVMELDSDTEVQEVLKRLKCDLHDQMLADDGDGDDDDDEGSSIRRGSSRSETIIRGDIPVFADCDDNLLVKTINKLIGVVNRLQDELERQRSETNSLRQLLEQCDICKPEETSRQTCRSNPPPCFPGVECQDMEDGPRCGRCPSGYVGDGARCKPGITCDRRPCYPGVRCYDTVEGFQCGPCPAGFTGDGVRCKARSGCDKKPCSPGVECINIYEPPYYQCGSCPEGFIGNGTNCHDLDECDLAEPCDPRVQCTNLQPGYRCGPCPVGFTGSSGVNGVGIDFAQRNRQACYDIDECADGRNGGCASNSNCYNTEGSFKCGPCASGFVGNQTIGCHNRPGLCPDGTHCDINAECYKAARDRYMCKCKIGWAGDGYTCGPDKDLDGWPDRDLGCTQSRCRKCAWRR
ncbi:thrombospondin 2 3 4 5 [Nesidiocoris tenuis]|uniref:Thrombospondin 2 3 4 5 n=1 Tax=Nesidiocoris tenuis TaxID=355587 RepID=A0ABN7AGB2_9HEMI|nr:thrombospondin 2 3 4 5 [Nesidiocoris tenuis]